MILKAVVPSMRRLGWAEGPASFFVAACALNTAVAASAADAGLARSYHGLNGVQLGRMNGMAMAFLG